MKAVVFAALLLVIVTGTSSYKSFLLWLDSSKLYNQASLLETIDRAVPVTKHPT